MDCKTEQLDSNRVLSEMFSKVFRAYMECSDEVQELIREMVEVAEADDVTDDEKEAALATIEDALFPKSRTGGLGADLEEYQESATGPSRDVLNQMKLEEATFAERLSSLLEAKEMTQEDLAEAIGVGQPAISMMLARDCRPQRRTLEKIASALKVSPEELWPGYNRE